MPPNVSGGQRARVVIVGVSTRAAAESAARAGYVVTSLDAFGDLDQHPGVRALSLPRDFGVAFSTEAAVEVAETIEADAVAYLSPFENYPAAVERLAGGRALWGNGAAVLRKVRDPGVVSNTPGASNRWLIKPRASGGGHGIRWWTPGDPVPSGSYVQPFVDGVPASIVFVAVGGEVVPLGLTRQLVGEPAFGATGFRYCGNILMPLSSRAERGNAIVRTEGPVIPSVVRNPKGPDRELSTLLESATQLARDFAARFNLVGVNCIDFIAQDDAAIPVEINPRWSASMELVERAYGVSMFGAHARACTAGELPSFDLERAQNGSDALGKAIVFARHDVTCGDTRLWLDDPTVRDVPHPGERITAGHPVCTVFANGADTDACHAALVTRANQVYELLESWSGVSV